MRSARVQERMFRLLIRAYPAWFRRRYEDELLIFFRTERARPHYRGTVGTLRFWRHTLSDVLSSALRHHQFPIPSVAPMLIAEFPRHVRLALRGIRNQPGFAAVVILSLAIGMSAALVVFSLVDAAVLEALPFEEGDGIVFIQGTLRDDRLVVRSASFPEIQEWRHGSSSFESMAALTGIAFNIVTDESVERVPGEIVGPEYFVLRRAQPLLGRLLGEQDNTAPGENLVAMIRETLWERRFERRADLIGKEIQLNDTTMTVIGILPEDFEGMQIGSEIWIPITMTEVVGRSTNGYGNRWMTAVARLRDDVSVAAAQSEIDAIALQLAAERPVSNDNRTGTLIGARDLYLGSNRDLLMLLLVAAVMLLLIAAANVAGLLIVRAETRRPEQALCLALGALRGSLALRVFTEALVLTVLGTALGWATAQALLSSLLANLPAGALPAFVEPRLDGTSLLFAGLLIVTATSIAALVPALWSSRGDLTVALRASRTGSPSAGRHTLSPQRVFVIAEIAIALVLLVSTGLMARTFATKLGVAPGFEAVGMQAFRLRIPTTYSDNVAVTQFAETVAWRLLAVPGVSTSTYGSDLPLRGDTSASYIAREGATDDSIRYYRHRVAPGFFEAMGIDVLQGRTFTQDDVAGAPSVVMISRELARRAFGDEDPIGKGMIRAPGFGDIPVTVVGVVDTVRWRDLTTDLLAGDDDPDVYFPFAQYTTRVVEFAVRTQPGTAALLPAIRDAVRSVDPEVAAYQLAGMEEHLRQQTAGDRLTFSILATFGGAALLLAGVGVYGTLSHGVRRRSREIAIRMAVGAPGARVRRAVLREGMSLAAFGALFGLIAAMGLTRVISGFLFGVSALDPMTYASVIAVLAFVAFAATWLPAVRATRVDPQEALRAE